MKNKILILLAVLTAASTFTGCGSPAQNIATANYLAGNAFATFELGKNPAALKGLQDLQAALPSLTTGKVTPFQMGVLSAELQPIANAAAADAKNAAALNQIGSLISAAVQANAGATGGLPNANTALVGAALTDFALGIQHGIDFYNGQQSVLAPKAP
jgi:hypothetical protein